MKLILLGILVLTFLTVVIVFFNDYLVKRKFRKFIERKYQEVYPLKHKLDSKEPITAAEIMNLLKQPGLRQAIYQLLTNYNRRDMFPSEYFTHEKGAESFLVTWLEYPTELGRAPDDIVLLTKVILDEGDLQYYVFKYRTKEPRWAAALDWMMGIVGPYAERSMPYEVPKRVFSRFNKVDSASPELEVRWVHENINQR
jgi:hypothetical protein